MSHSIIKVPYDGSTTDYDLTFTLGYTSESQIDVHVEGDPPVSLPFDFIRDTRIRLTDTSELSVNDVIAITRTVTKEELAVDLTVPGSSTRDALQSNHLQLLYAVHELLDGRIGDAIDVDDLIIQQVQGAVELAIESFVFQTQFIDDVVLRPTLTSDEIVTYISNARTAAADDIDVYVENAPSVDIDVLVYNNASVVFSFTVNQAGNVINRSTAALDLAPGSLRVDVSGSNYVSGAEVSIVIPTVQDLLVDFQPTFPDFVADFNTARTD